MKSALLLDGRAVASGIEENLKKTLSPFSKKPTLAVFLVGNNPASTIYVEKKIEAAERIGITTHLKHYPPSLTENELLELIQAANRDPDVDGIIVQLPLPPHIDPLKVALAIDPTKDVDGFHPLNLGLLLSGVDISLEMDTKQGFIPCTPKGIKRLLDAYKIDVSLKHVVVIGRSNIVGKPMAALLSQITPGFNATTTILHRDSKDFSEITQTADILIVATGKPLQITEKQVKEGAVVIDVGIHRLNPSKKIVGDTDFENILHKCSAITPVPGGVGPMTVVTLMENTVIAFLRKNLPLNARK